MKLSRVWGNTCHVAAIVAQGATAAIPFLPWEVKVPLMTGIAITQAVIGNAQQNANPDGTPASQPYRSLKAAR